MATPITQPVTGDVENVLYDLYPELLDPTLAPMPSMDGTTSLGRRLKDELYGGAGLLGGGVAKPDLDNTRGELDVEAAAGGAPSLDPSNVIPAEKVWPDYGVPAIPPPGPPVAGPVAGPPGPVDLGNLPLIPPLVPGPYPGIGTPFPSTDTGRIPPSPYPGIGTPFPSHDRGTPPYPRVSAGPTPVSGTGIIPFDDRKQPDPRDTQPYRPSFDVSRGGEADQPGFVSRRSDDDDVYKGLNISDDKKAEIETVANDAKTFLQGVGYFDDGPFGFAQSLMLMYGGGLEPTVTQGPAVPYRERGQPMTTDRYLNFATGSPNVPSLLPEGQRLGQITPSGDTVSVKADKETKTTRGRGSLGLGDTAIRSYLDNKTFDVIGSNLYPEVKIATDGQRYFDNEADLVNWAGGFMEDTGIDVNPYFYEKVIDGIKKTGNYILDGGQTVLNIIQSFADFVGDPSKAEGEDATLGTLEESYRGFVNELTEFWQTNPNNLWGRNMFKPGETQKYGSLQPYAIISALSNPPAALAIAVKTLIKDIMFSAKNMFADEANYDGNYVQDIINGAFHLVGSGIKSFGKNFNKLIKKDETPAAGETAEDSKWLRDIAGKLEKSTDDKLRDNWLTHAAFNSATHKITKAFLAEGIPVVMKENKDRFIKAINDRKMDDFFGLMDEFGLDLSVFDQLAGVSGLDPAYGAEKNMIDILREWERQRRASENL